MIGATSFVRLRSISAFKVDTNVSSGIRISRLTLGEVRFFTGTTYIPTFNRMKLGEDTVVNAPLMSIVLNLHLGVQLDTWLEAKKVLPFNH